MHCLHLLAKDGDVECIISVAAFALHVKNNEESEFGIETLKYE